MISILRGSFDIILPCVLDAAGRCKLPPQMSGDMQKLEKMLGCAVAGTNLKDLLAGEESRLDHNHRVVHVGQCCPHHDVRLMSSDSDSQFVACVKTLLAHQEDKSDFSAYVRNVVRQADCPQGSEVSLSTQGIWTCSAGSMPPIAQVLHSN